MSHAYPPTEQALVARIIRQPAFRELTDLPLVAWQEAALVLACYAAIFGSAALYLQGLLPYPFSLLISGLAIYAVFTPLHDATHRSASRNPMINDIIGTLAAQPMVPGATTSLYRYLHLEHHRHTGDPDRDPDEALVSSGPLGRLFIAMFIELKWMRWYLKHYEQRSRNERALDLFSVALYVSWHAVWLLSPYATEFVLLWVLPQRLGLTIVAYLFAAIQHPAGVLEHESPFQATRMFRGGTLMRILMISQSQHLMHHLFPMVPYYRYNGAWKLAEPELREQALVWDTPVGRLAMPDSKNKNAPLLNVRIVATSQITEDIRAYTFAAIDGRELPAFKAGAHIDVHISPDMVRQYSLTGLASRTHYSIAVKRENDGRGGSRLLHENFTEGQTLQISHPRNLFQLQPNDSHAVLISGGIGITPILSMARELERSGTSFEMHACARSRSALAFADVLDKLSGNVQTWLGDQRLTAEKLPAYATGYSLYLCGPDGFMQYIRELAASRGWPASAIHSEKFQASGCSTRGKPFTVELARSAKVLDVPADQSLLEVLQENQVRIAASCVQGLCGTCSCKVLSGEVEHRDQFFSAQQHSAGFMTACVSRAKGHLILDL